jgi:putative replication protein
MKQTSGLLARFNRLVPVGVTPKFTTVEEWHAWQQAEGRRQCEVVVARNRQNRAAKLLGRSGIRELHQRCTFSNYRVTCEGQCQAYSMARSWLDRYGTGVGGFVFSGPTGTGKNHLAAAIGNQLMSRGKTVVIASVADLMTQMRARYGGTGSRAEFIGRLCSADLLVISGIGVLPVSRHERLLLNQIVDRRIASCRPIGLITSLDAVTLGQLLGERVIDHLRMGGGMWVSFTWESYRPGVGQ